MDPEDMTFTVEVGRRRRAARGELDLATAEPSVRAAGAGRGAWDRDARPRGLRFLDTSGLRLVLETVEASRRDGFGFSVLPGVPEMQRLFDLAGVTDMVPFANGRDRRSGDSAAAEWTRPAGSRP